MSKRMDQYFSVFNNHVNNALERATTEFIAQYDQEYYDNEIAPYRLNGIMSIFHTEPNLYTAVFVALVTNFVNENRTES